MSNKWAPITPIPERTVKEMADQITKNANAPFEHRQRKDDALFEAYDTLKSIRSDLGVETADRKMSDAENLKYTKKMDGINLFLAIVGVLFGAAGFVVSLIK